MIASASATASSVDDYADWMGGTTFEMSSDFYVDGALEDWTSVHKREGGYGGHQVYLDGKGQFSYILEDVGCAWMDAISASNPGKISLINMKDIAISGITYTGTVKNVIFITVEDSETFTFSDGKATSSQAVVTYSGSLDISSVDRVSFNQNAGRLFYNSNVTFTGIEELKFTGNSGTIFDYELVAGERKNDGPVFTNCGIVVFDGNSGDGGIIAGFNKSVDEGSQEAASATTQFINCTKVSIIDNEVSGRDLFHAIKPVFTDCPEVEILSNTSTGGPLISKGLVATGIDLLKINGNNVSRSNNSSGTSNAMLISQNNSNSLCGADTLQVSGKAGDSILEIKNNTGNGRFAHIVAVNIDVEDFKTVDISGNQLDVVTDTAINDAIGTAKLQHVDEILIKDNRVSASGTVKRLIAFADEKLEDFGTLTVSGNQLGVDAEGNIIASNVGHKNHLLSGFTAVGRSNGGLTSQVIIDSNKISVSKYNNSSNGSTYSDVKRISLKDLHTLEITNNISYNACKWLGDALELNNIENVKIDGNSLGVGGSIDYALLTINAVSLSGGESFEVTNNTTLGEGTVGGALAIRFSSTSTDDVISAAKVNISGNLAEGSKALGGAMRLKVAGKTYALNFADSDTITILKNGAQGDSFTAALGGAIYGRVESTIQFKNNEHVLIRGNYVTDGTNYRLNAFDVDSDLVFKTKSGQSVECYDGLTLDAAWLYINGDASDQSSDYKGVVKFSGKYAEQDLKDLVGNAYTEEDLLVSRTIQAGGVHVYNGTLSLEDGIRMEVTSKNGFASDKAAVVQMRNATLHMKSATATVNMATAVFEGQNVIAAEQLIAEGGTWTFYVSSENSEKALLSVNPSSTKVTISTKNQKVDVVFDTVLADGAYKLVEFDNTKGTWSNAATLEFSGTVSSKLGSKGKDDVYFTVENNVYTLWAEYSSGASAVKPPRPATTLTWEISAGIWADAAGMEDGAWSGTVDDLNFYKGDHVVFDKAASVTVGSKVLPANITVSNADGKVTFTSANGGQITGSTGIVKSGDGELELNLANAYTGDTTITAGKLTVGDKNALGLSTVELQGGELNLGGIAVNNSVHATKTAVINGGSAYDGKLTLDGGSLTGDALNLNQDAELLSGSIANVLTGTGGVVKKGAAEVILSGANSYTGTTLVSEGTLTLQGASVSGAVLVEKKGTLSLTDNASLNTELTVDGGTLDVQAGSSLRGTITLNSGSTATVADGFALSAGDKLTLAGATVNADVSVATGGVLALTAAQEIEGNVELDGGTLDLQEGSTLSVNGNITINSNTEVLLDFAALRAAGDAGLTVLSAASITGTQSDLDFVGLDDTRHITDWQDTYVNIKLTSATLTWDDTTTNSQWRLKDEANSGNWSTDADDTVYYDMDDVIFDNAGEVEIVGAVKPGSITVRKGETTFTGNGNIAGSAELVVSEGKLRVATSNTDYTGAITVKDNGTLVVEAEKALGSGAVSVEGSNFDSAFFEVDNVVAFSGKSTINAVAARNVVFAKESIVSGNYTLAPSNTLTVLGGGSSFGEGEFTFAGGTLVLEDNSSQFSIMGTTLFDGMAPMGGKAAAQVTTINLTGWTITPGETYTLMSYTANGMGNPEDYFSLLLPEEWMSDYATLEYNDGTLMLTVERPTGNMPQVMPNLSRNKQAVYNVLSNIAAFGLAEGTLAKYANRVAGTQDVNAVRELLALLDGEELASAMTSQIEGNMAHLRRLRSYIGSGHLFAPKEGMAAYVTAYNDTHRLHGDAAGPGIRRVEWGASAGIETRLDKDTLVGVGLSDGRARISSTDISATRAHEDTTRVDAYLATDLGGGFQSVTSVGLGFHHYNYRRILPDGERSRTTDMDGASFNFMQEFSCSLYAKDDEVVNAYAGLQSSVNRIGSFSESGAGSASLAGGKRNAWATDISLGLRYAHSFAMVEGASAAELSLRSGVVVSVGDTTADLNLHFAGAPTAGYRVSSAHRNRVGYNLSADLLVPVDKNMAITGGAGAILRGDSSEASASVGIRINF